MAQGIGKTSNKLHIIDRTTFEAYQQSSKSDASKTGDSKTVRNAKYKKTSKTTFNLLDFLTHRPKQTSSQRKRAVAKARTLSVATLIAPIKRRGKQREGGRRKRVSRLKRAILRHRKKQRSEQEQFDDISEELSSLKLENSTSDAREQVAREVKISSEIHSRRFRDYCDNCTTSGLCSQTQSLLRDLNFFQRRAFALNDIKARAHRRFVLGFREANNYMAIDKIKILFIATDLEVCSGDVGLDTMIAKLKTQCQTKNIPCVFSLGRRQIAHTLYKKVPISCVAVLDYDGARDKVAHLKEELQLAREAYRELRQHKEAALIQEIC